MHCEQYITVIAPSWTASKMLVRAGSVAQTEADCIPLGALIAQRFNRSPMNRLRMLRGDADMEQLIRTHHNCMLKADRIRFKKSNLIDPMAPATITTTNINTASADTKSRNDEDKNNNNNNNNNNHNDNNRNNNNNNFWQRNSIDRVSARDESDSPPIGSINSLYAIEDQNSVPHRIGEFGNFLYAFAPLRRRFGEVGAKIFLVSTSSRGGDHTSWKSTGNFPATAAALWQEIPVGQNQPKFNAI